MSNYSSVADISGGGYAGGFGGGHGMGGWLIGALIIFFLLFRDGFGHRGGHEGGHGGDRGRERNWFPDESNYQQSRELDNHMCRLDADIRNEGEKTRGLITENVIQELRDKNTEKAAKILQLEAEAYNGARFGRLESALEALACRMPHLEPQYIATRGMCLAERPSCGEPRRGGGCGFD